MELTQPPQVIYDTLVSDVLCYGESSGSISLSVIGGVEPYTFLWSNNETTPDIENLQAGIFQFTITDANGCEFVDSVTVEESPEIVISSVIENVTCFGENSGSISNEITGGSEPYQFLWTTNQTTATIENLFAGEYSLLLTDNFGCEVNSNFTVNQPDSIEIDFAVTNPLCYLPNSGAIEIEVIGGVEPYNFLWTGGETTQNLWNIPEGVYKIQITDANSCIAIDSTILLQDEGFEISANQSDTICYHAQNGFINIFINGGSEPFSFLWNNNETSQNIDNLSGGSYSVTITDANQCSQTVSFFIEELSEILTTAIIDSVDCFGTQTGSIELFTNGGLPPYSFSIDGNNFQTVNVFQNLIAGEYTIYINDSFTCGDTLETAVYEPQPLEFTILETQDNLCFGYSEGSINVNVTGGSPSYVFSIDGLNFQNIGLFENLSAADYTITAKDFHNCIINSTLTISEPTELISNVAVTNISTCFGDENGILEISLNGGTSPYLYSIDNLTFQENTVFENLAAGNYTIYFKDANNCYGSETKTVNQPELLVINFTNTDITTCFGDNNATISITASGGTLPYSFSINNGEEFFNFGTFQYLTAGNYFPLVKDSHNCQSIGNIITITEPNELIFNEITTIPANCVTQNSGEIFIEVSGGTAPYQFSIGNGFGSENSFNQLIAGNYEIFVFDINNCDIHSSVVVEENDCFSLLEVPNVFSPNDDGINDEFRVNYKNLAVFEAQIYNRWGELLYTWHSPETGWDGTIYNSNQKASEGVYYYIITALGEDSQTYFLKGTFQLYK